MHRGLLRFVIAVVALGIGALTVGGVAAASSSSPVVELHLDSLGSGATPDSSPNHLSVTAQGALIADGRFDHALRMSSAGDFVNVASDPVLAPAEVTVMAWVRQSGYAFDQFLVGKPYPAAGCNTDSYGLTSGLSTGVRFIVDVNGAQGKTQYSTPESATSSVWDGQWHAIAGTYDGSTVSLYQDGQLVGSTATGGSPLLYDTTPADARLAGLYAGIPSNSNHCSFDQKYSGDIDEIRVYDRALTAAEIANLQSPGALTPPENPGPPTVLAAPADGVSSGGATLHGMVTPNGSGVTDCHFEYGISTAYGSSVPCAQGVGGGTTGVPVSAVVSGLSPATTYDFKLTATNGLGAASDTGTFTTAVDMSVYRPPTASLETIITSGPDGYTSAAPTFTFASMITGATFECAFDGDLFRPCSTPLITYGLKWGSHTFHVRSVSPQGARDPRPAGRSFTLGTTSGQGTCTVQIPWSYRLINPFTGGGTPLGCDPVKLACPVGANCTATATASLADGDRYALWDATVAALWSFNGGAAANETGPLTEPDCADPEVNVLAGVGPGSIPTRCPTHSTSTVLGPAHLSPNCWDSWLHLPGYVTQPHAPVQGPDNQRRITCHVSYAIVPAVGLVLSPGIGVVVSVIAPGPGTLALAGGGASAKAAAVSQTAQARTARHRHPPPIRTVRIHVQAAGPLQIKPTLSAAAAKTLRRHRRLVLHLALRFTPRLGAVINDHQTITLISAVCTPQHPIRTTRRHAVPNGCPTHR